MDMNDIQKILSDKKVVEMISKMSTSDEVQNFLKEKGIELSAADVKKVLETLSSQKDGLDLGSIANLAGGLFGKKD